MTPAMPPWRQRSVFGTFAAASEFSIGAIREGGPSVVLRPYDRSCLAGSPGEQGPLDELLRNDASVAEYAGDPGISGAQLESVAGQSVPALREGEPGKHAVAVSGDHTGYEFERVPCTGTAEGWAIPGIGVYRGKQQVGQGFGVGARCNCLRPRRPIQKDLIVALSNTRVDMLVLALIGN